MGTIDPEAARRVRALPVGSRWRHRYARAVELVREKFWSIPLVLIVAGALTATLVSRPEMFGLPGDWQFKHIVRTSTADTLLQVMASSMLTFVGVVFAITLVGLQLASSQVSPRVIRTFVRSGVTKTAFGVFLATFAFAITCLAFDDVHDPAAATRTALMSVLMLTVAVVVFVVYVTATLRLLEVGWVVTSVANEARGAIEHAFPRADDYVEAASPSVDGPVHLVRLPTTGGRSYRGQLGTVLGIDRPHLVALASRHDCAIELLPRIGEYVPTGGVVFAVRGNERPGDAEILRCLDLGRVRTLYQDPTYGVRQLVDVATQALSPAINQPTTAVLVIDRLHDLLLRISRRPVPTGLYVDARGVLRLMTPTSDWPYLVRMCFDEIVALGVGSRHVTRRVAAAYSDLAASVPDDLLPILREMQEDLEAQVRQHTLRTDVQTALAPDRLGLG